MSTLIYVACAVGLVLLIALVASIIWLAKSRKAQAKAETQKDALEAAVEKQSVADEIMAEPVADESAWLADLDRRLHDGSDQS